MLETTTQVCIYLLTVYPLNSKLPTWNAKCPIFRGNFTPKTSNYCLKNRALGFPGIQFKEKRDIPPRYCWLGRDHFAKKNATRSTLQPASFQSKEPSNSSLPNLGECGPLVFVKGVILGPKKWPQQWVTGAITPIPSGKLTWQWKITLLKMYSLLRMGISHCYVSFPEGTWSCNLTVNLYLVWGPLCQGR